LYAGSDSEHSDLKVAIGDAELETNIQEDLCSGDVPPTHCRIISPDAGLPRALGKRAEVGNGVTLKVLLIGEYVLRLHKSMDAPFTDRLILWIV
jgi:hypothetical protein